VPTFVFEALELAVRVDSHIPKTVVFVGLEVGNRFQPRGTGFIGQFVHKDDYHFPFLVTADHVLNLVPGDYVWMRMNRRDGSCSTVKLSKADAKRAYKEDIAIFPLKFDPAAFEWRSLSLSRADFEANKKKWEWDIGDEVAVVGLYGSHFGQVKNVPVTRIGHIALMPGEPVAGPRGELVAYLVEGKSISGLSGSPVLLNAPMWKVGSDSQMQTLTGPLIFPIGMVLGYHSVESLEDQIPVSEIQGEDAVGEGSKVDRNTGLTTVVPFERILDMMDDLDWKKAMDKSVDERRQWGAFKEAGLGASNAEAGHSAPPATDANPTHREDFTSLLSAAARKPPQGGQT
jgi:hypothetical protein